MIQKPIKPKKQYTNFYVYLHNVGISCDGLSFKCTRCNGYGLIYDPNDPPCPIEGNKLRHRIICPKCIGGKTGTKAEWKSIYNEEVLGYYKRQLATYKRNIALYNSIIKKLNQEELKYIGIK